MIEIIEFLAGATIVFFVLNDVFQSVVVPRPSPWGGFRLTRLVVRGRWRGGRTLGLGLMLSAPHTQTHPPLENLPMAMYYAGTSLLTIGYGDIVAQSALARLVSITAGIRGLWLISVGVRFIFLSY